VRLAATWGCTPGEAVAARDDAAVADWPGYVRALFADSRTAGMVMDAGWQGSPPGGAAAYADLSVFPCGTWHASNPSSTRCWLRGAARAKVCGRCRRLHGEPGPRRCGGVQDGARVSHRVGGGPVCITCPGGARAGRRPCGWGPGTTQRKTIGATSFFRHALGPLRQNWTGPCRCNTGFGDSEIRLAESDPLLLEEVLRHR